MSRYGRRLSDWRDGLWSLTLSRGARLPHWRQVLAICVGALVCVSAALPALSEPPPQSYANRLVGSGSPYLRQHANNPVDWYPWGEEAIAKAKNEDKPIFLSVGYSTCYWCHVAERTLFSKPEIAALMNKWFVNVKVDREERPDIDETYMLARQLLTGAGGWPNNVFLTPDLKPFYAGSYFPPEDQGGSPGFPTLLKFIHESWEKDRDKLEALGRNVSGTLARLRDTSMRAAPGLKLKPWAWLDTVRDETLAREDKEAGGFGGGGRTKFPQSPLMGLLITDYRLNGTAGSLAAVTGALNAMAFGGIHDQLGGGMHRYSTEPSWSVPHFEKMLYDNAQLLGLYADVYEISRSKTARMMAADIAGYVARRLSAPRGGFYTAEDADIDGNEGETYIWARDEITRVLGDSDAQRFFALYDLAPMPENPSGPGVLRVHNDRLSSREDRLSVLVSIVELAPLRERLMKVRNKRRQTARDEKIVVMLNGLAISALARAGVVFEKREWISSAELAGEMLWEQARDGTSGKLCRYIFDGKPFGSGFLEDYAHLGLGFVALFDATGERVWLSRANELASAIESRFVDDEGVVVTTEPDPTLIVPAIDLSDGDTASGTSAAYTLFARLGRDNLEFKKTALRILRWVGLRVESSRDSWPSLVANAAMFEVSETSLGVGVLDSAAHVKAVAVGSSGDAHDGIVVTLTIDPKYHLNANPASSDNLIATTVKVPFAKVSKITYPAGQVFTPRFMPEGLSVYEGSVAIKIELPSAALGSAVGVPLELAVQACNDKLCLPPATISVSVKLP